MQTLANALLGVVCFSLAASSIYILNDILDIKDDQADPVKKHRPIASGALSVSSAIKIDDCFDSCCNWFVFIHSHRCCVHFNGVLCTDHGVFDEA